MNNHLRDFFWVTLCDEEGKMEKGVGDDDLRRRMTVVVVVVVEWCYLL